MRLLGTADLDMLEAMMEPLRDAPFFVKDAELRYVAANSAMAELCGRQRAGDLYGRRAHDLFLAEEASHFETLDWGVLATGLGFRDQLIRSSSTRGRRIWLLFGRTPVFNGAGVPVGIVATARQLQETARNAASLRRLSRALGDIRRRLAEPLDSEALARHAGTSPSQLHRDFKRYLGTTPRDLQHRLRLERALGLLRGDMPISEVAQACGYADQSAFTRRVRQLSGRTPGELRVALQAIGS